jgi:5-methylcytosine-specific restriction endonuclease McrA
MSSRLHRGGRPRDRALRLVIERDGDRCRRCGGVVDLRLGGLHPDGPTLGHVVPAMRGGGDELANLALEHRRCNLAAGSRLTPPRAAIVAPIQEG